MCIIWYVLIFTLNHNYWSLYQALYLPKETLFLLDIIIYFKVSAGVKSPQIKSVTLVVSSWTSYFIFLCFIYRVSFLIYTMGIRREVTSYDCPDV